MIDQKQIEAVVREAQERKLREQVDTMVELQTKIVTTSYDKATAYTNVIIVAGYAAFFGLWTLTKTYVSKPLAIWAALLMCISAGTFVFFEIYKMVFIGNQLNRQILTLGERIKNKSATEVLKELQDLESYSKRAALRFQPVWRVVLLLAVATGLGAFLVLSGSFIYALLSGNA